MSTPIIINPMIFRELGLEEGIRKALAMGFDQIEIWRVQVEEFRTQSLRNQLRDFVVSLGSTIVGLNSCDQSFFQSLSGINDVDPALQGFKADIEAAADLGAAYVCNFEGRRPEGANDADVAGPIFEATLSLFQQACAHGADRGVQVLVEVHPFTLGTDLEWLCRLCDRLDDEQFGVIYDACHFGVGLPEGYLGAIGKLGSRIKCVHFSDSDMVSSELHFPPGKGCLDLAGIVGELKRIDFRGKWMVDPWLYPLPELAARSGLEFLRKALGELP
jgi:sugar phosphate isomerase/epimerase